VAHSVEIYQGRPRGCGYRIQLPQEPNPVRKWKEVDWIEAVWSGRSATQPVILVFALVFDLYKLTKVCNYVIHKLY
jgi:hypothetical protein